MERRRKGKKGKRGRRVRIPRRMRQWKMDLPKVEMGETPWKLEARSLSQKRKSPWTMKSLMANCWTAAKITWKVEEGVTSLKLDMKSGNRMTVRKG